MASVNVVHCRKAAYDVYIGRPGKFGNPFTIGADGDRAQVLIKYREYLRTRPDLVAAAKADLRGKVLGCWCAPLPCHGDLLAKVADGKDDLKPGAGYEFSGTDEALGETASCGESQPLV